MIGTSASAGWRPLQKKREPRDAARGEQIRPEALDAALAAAPKATPIATAMISAPLDEMKVRRRDGTARAPRNPSASDAIASSSRNGIDRVPPEDDPRDEIADGEVGRERHRPGDRQHRLVERSRPTRTWISAGTQRGADRGDDRQQRAPPRVEHAARRRRFDHFLGHQREEEHHRDVVDGERDRVGEAVVALGSRY